MQTDTYGLLSLAGIEIALPLSALREVVPCPDEFQPLPTKAEGFLGAMELRGSIVPVVDISHRVDGAERSTESQVVVVMTNGGYVIGLRADQLRSIANVEADAFVAVESADATLLFDHTFIHAESQTIVSVLNVDELFKLPGVPLMADVSATKSKVELSNITHANQADDGETHRFTTVKCGPYLLAFDIHDVHTTVPSSDVRPSVLSGDICQGVTTYFGYEVPVLDPLVLLGLGVMPKDSFGAGLVLKREEGYVILALSALLALQESSLEGLASLPQFAVQRPEYFHGMMESDAGLCMVVDGNALMSNVDLKSYASVNTVVDASATNSVDGEATEVQAARDGQAHLTFSIGFDVATPLEQIGEILPLPEETLSTNGDEYIMGVIPHRDAVLPVICLRTLLGLEPLARSGQHCLLLVTTDVGCVAVAVDDLRAIDTLTWEDPTSQVEPITEVHELSHALQRAPLINVAAHRELTPKLDLRQIVSVVQSKTGVLDEWHVTEGGNP